jgi:hypothetical protein
VLTTDQKGAIAETAVVAEAVKLGVPVSRPVQEGLPYDLLFEIGGHFVRVQCKWAARKGDGINWAEAFEFGATLGNSGAVAQLGERQSGTLEAAGSSPAGSTERPPIRRLFAR